MKFIHYLETIAGISIFPLVSLLIFFLFFSLLLLFALKADKQYITELKNIPIDNEPNQLP